MAEMPRKRNASRDEHSARVEVLTVDEDGERIEELRASDLVEELDLLPRQVGELADTRSPTRKLSDEDKRLAYQGWVEERYGGDEVRAGVWIHYPWTRRLIRCLPEAEFFELRTNRNRNKITADEQARIGRARVGVVGLSVGHASAITLAQEGVGGEFRLADFDVLDTSNLNRLRTSLHNVGLNKSVITAREMLESNPYLKIEVFTEGITEDNIEAFFDGPAGAPGIDLLVEECDDMAMKVRLREEARRRRIPVLMETSDRGLLDVERFDLEPERPLLHGYAEGLEPARLSKMSNAEKVPYVLRMLGGTNLSERLAASLVDIETTLKTWPQLASSVALGSAVITDTARRILLGELQASGRFYVDLDELVSVDNAASVDVEELARITVVEETREVPRIDPPQAKLEDLARWLAEHGTLAPSGGNCQPWRFEFTGDALRCVHAVERSKSFLDYRHAAAYLALGAAAENVVQAGSDLGLELRPEFHPPGADPERAPASFEVRLPSSPPLAVPGPASRRIRERVTNRQLAPREPLEAGERAALFGVAEAHDARLHLLEEAGELEAIEDVLGEAERQRMLSEVMHRELFEELRFTPEETLRTLDGIDVATLEMSLADLAGLKLLQNFRYLKRMRRLATGQGLSKAFRKSVRRASAIGLLTVAERSPEAYFRGGRAIEAVWLEATDLGLGFQPLTSSLYVINRVVDGAGEGLDASQRKVFASLRERMAALFPLQAERAEIMIFRLAKVPPPTARALRLPLEQVSNMRGSGGGPGER